MSTISRPKTMIKVISKMDLNNIFQYLFRENIRRQIAIPYVKIIATSKPCFKDLQSFKATVIEPSLLVVAKFLSSLGKPFVMALITV